MIYILIISVVIILIGRGVGKVAGKIIAPDDDYSHYDTKTNDSPTIIHNHITENHLHVTKEDLEQLVDSKKSNSSTH